MGQRLESDDAAAGIEGADRPAQGYPKGDHPFARPQSPHRGHAAGIFAVSQRESLSRGSPGSNSARSILTAFCEPEMVSGSPTIKAVFMALYITIGLTNGNSPRCS